MQLGITKLYPNPTSGFTNVNYICNIENQPIQIIVYNSKGYVVIKQYLSVQNSEKNIQNPINNNIVLNTSTLKSGEYYVLLISKKTYCLAKKIIVI